MTDKYAPDSEALDSLVDLDGAPLPPSAAEAAIAALEPIDAEEVVFALRHAVDLAENFLIRGTGSPEDRLLLYVTLVDVLNLRDGSLATVKRGIGEALAPDLAEGLECEGRWWKAGRERKITGWRNDDLRSAINRAAMAPVEVKFDLATGERLPDDAEPDEGTFVVGHRDPTTKEVVERLWVLAEPAKGRTGKLREAGIDPDEYATVAWNDTIVKEDGPQQSGAAAVGAEAAAASERSGQA